MRHHDFWPAACERAIARILCWFVFAIALGWCQEGHAQWSTQTNSLKPGWNAVFLHVDASYATLNELVGNDPNNPIEEVWYWQPTLPTGQFVDSPQVPSSAGTQWSTWTRALGPDSLLQRLTPNGAYLVKVSNRFASYSWLVKGKPVLPTYRWTLTGLNFIGFPTPPSKPPTFDSFLVPAPQLQQNGEVYRYQGGELGPTNPVRVVGFRNTNVRNDQAYWVRAGETYNQYFGPIQILQSGVDGIRFGDSQGQAQIRVRNLANVPITLTLRALPSESSPGGQTNIVGVPPLLLRGAINTTNLTFGYSSLGDGPKTWNLAAAGQVGSEVELIIGLNRTQMAGGPGALFAGMLRFTDSLGLSQIDMGVSAVKESSVGLWVGGAEMNYVSHYLKPYARATNAPALASLLARLQLAEGADGYHYERDPNSGRVLVFGGPDKKTGSYLLDGPIKVDSGTVASPFPLRLIIHNNGSSAKLLQKVFHGVGLGSNTVLTTREELILPAQLGEARRISAVQLPTSAGNIPWPLAGTMRQGGSLTATVPLAYDDQTSNPFLHTYHPDHDNLDAQFQNTLPRGQESYGVVRQITLNFKASEDHFNGLTQGSQDLTGSYAEVITFQARGSQTRSYNVLGSFTLKRISDIDTLTSN